MKHSENYNSWRKCYSCHESFREKDNIGQLYCRIHPGIIYTEKDLNRYYSCCGVRVDSYNMIFRNNNLLLISENDKRGCLKIDHFDKEYLKEKLDFFSPNDIYKRIDQIKSISITAVPDQLYTLGITKPRKECILDTVNINQCYQLYHNNTNYFIENSQIRTYNLDIMKNALYSHHHQRKEKKDNIKIDLIPLCNQIDSMLDSNKDFQKSFIDNIWNENITTTSNEDILLVDNIRKNIDNEIQRTFQMVKRIDNQFIYTY
jgi:hypothetical protein